MSDDFEDLLKRWLRDRAGNDRSALQALAGNVAALPPRRPNRRRPLAVAASVIVMVGLLAFALPRFGGIGGEATPTAGRATQPAVLPGGPEPYVALHDARLGQCFGTPEDMEFVFEMNHARDYRSHLPRMGRSPELEVDEPAFVVVYRDGWQGPMSGGALGGERESPTPGLRFVCVLVQGGDPNLYSNVDIDGLTVAIAPSATQVSTDATPDLVPVWAVNLDAQLDCDGPPQAIGGEIRTFQPVGGTGTASPWPWLYGEDAADLPLEGWTEEPKVPWETGGSDVMRYINTVEGRTKAIIIMGGHSTDGGPGHWEIVAFRACPPDEYDPLRGRTTDDAPWTDADGQPTTLARTIVGPAHCGWESTVWLFLDGSSRLYLRDPLGVLREHWVGDYVASTTLPDDAETTGLRSRDRELFTTPNEDFVYIQTPDGVERWPRSNDPFIGCA
jgi:hypothetical protein